jgi:N-acyl-D-amino-acid deacylase
MLDLVIRDGRVIDGAGNPWFRADVGVRGERIVAVGEVSARGSTEIDATDLVVCPGFTDMHTHSDIQLLANPAHECKVHQGVTCDVIGQDGLAYAPVTDEVLGQLRVQLAGWNDDPPELDWGWRTVGEYLDRFDRGVAVNAAYLVPHATVRMVAMGTDDRAPTEAELVEMKRLVHDGLEQGAVGLSSGLTYAPGMFATDDELVELCRVLREFGAYYTPHHRNYGMTALDAYRDCIAIARRAGVPLHYAHAHLGFDVNKGRAPELLAMIDEARATGIDVTLDTYPYLAGATYLHAYLPGWVHAGGTGAAVARLRAPALRERIRVELEETGSDGFHDVPIDWTRIVVSGVRKEENRHFVGRSVADAAATAGERPVDLYCELCADEELGASSIAHIGNEENVRAIMQHPAHMAGSDGIIVGERPHPRGWGTFPRYLAVYVRELGILTWEQAIRKLTSLPAQRLGFPDRGLVRPGMAADLVCFDPETVRDTATYENPKQLPEGIPTVAVNGRVVVDDGRHTGDLPGRALRGGQAAASAS